MNKNKHTCNEDASLALANYRKGNFLILLATAVVILLSAKSLRAQTNAYWDVNGTTTGEGGTGTWSTSGTNWTTNSVNATANSGGPTGGGLFAVANGAAGATLTNSGNYIFNFGGTAGTVTQGGAFQGWGVNFLTSGYTWNIDGTGTNSRTITTTNGVSLGANSLTLANGSRGLNSFTFAGNTTATAVGITGSSGATLTLRNLVADSSTNSFGVYLSGGTISSNIAINVDIGTGSKVFFGSQSSATSTVSANIALNTNASGVALNITNTSGVLNLNGAISGANGLVLDNSGSGKIVINGANTYTGGTTVNGTGTGQINLGSSSALGTGTVTISAGSTSYLRTSVNALDVTNAVSIGSGATLQLAATNSGWKSTWSGAISGAGGINYGYSDSGLYLTGTNSSFGGGINVSSSGSLYVSKLGMAGSNSSIGTNGIITIGSSSGTSGASEVRWQGSTDETSDKNFALTTASSAASAGVKIFATGATNATLTLNGNINSTGISNKVITLAGYNTNTLVMNGTINETAGYTNSLVVGASSSGRVVLGNSGNSFSGGITITNATGGQTTWLEAAGIGNTGANSYLGKGSTISFGSTNSSAATVLKYTGSGETSDKVLNLAGTTTVATLDQSGAGNLKFSSALTGSGAGAKTIALQGSTAGTGELAGAISDLGGNVTSLTKSGSGTWTLSGANTYTGGTTINGGTLATSGNNVLADDGAVTIGNGATFKLGGNDAVSSVVSTTNAATLNLQGNTLTVGGTGLSFTNTATTTGTGGIVKNGAGQIYLNNGANTYSGGFTLNNGEVQFSTSGSQSGGALQSSVFGLGTLTLNGGTISSSSAAGSSGRTVYNNIALNGNIQFGMNSWSNASGVMNSGTALFTASTNVGNTTTLAGNSTLNTLGYVQWDQAMSGNFRLTKAGTGDVALSNNYLSLRNSNNIAGVTVNSGILGYKNRNAFGTGTLILADGVVVGQDGIINNPSLTGNDQTDRSVANSIQLNGNVTFGLGGTANHLGGAMDLTGANRTITLGNTTYQYGAVTNGGLVIDNGTVAGSRTFGLFASNNYSGGTVVRTNAILAVGNDKALGDGNLTFTNTTGSGSATLRASTLSTSANQLRTIANNIQLANGMNVTVDAVSSAQDSAGTATTVALNTTLSGSISGSGSLTKTNSNTLTLSGSNSYSGATTVAAGTLNVSGNITSSSETRVNSGSVLSVASGGSVGAVTNAGTATISGSAGNINSTGTTTIGVGGTAGALNIIGGTSTVNGTAGNTTINSGGKLKGSGTVGALEIASGGTLAVGNSPGIMNASSSVWNGGGHYQVEVSNFLGSQGNDWDFLNVSGTLSINATSGNKFIIDVVSLLASNNAPGNASGFLPNWDRSIAIATAAGGVLGFDSAYFGFDTSAFTNSREYAAWSTHRNYAPGSFNVSLSGNTIFLNYARAIPEPTTGSLVLVGLLGVLASRRSRRSTS